MLGFLIDSVSRDHLRFFRSLCFVALTGLAVAACAIGESPAQNQTPSAQQAQIDVQTSQLSVLIENKVGMPLVDVEVAILPVGGIMQFTKFAGRMENAEKRDIALSSFAGRDGTPFNLRMVRPKTVRVTGKDLNNKPVQVDVPWK
jgi:hypothetical protein